MFEILKKEELNPTVTRMIVSAPLIAKKAEPGQFIILRVDENGERMPLTIADYDREKGTLYSALPFCSLSILSSLMLINSMHNPPL
jgi:NAD(P)H-flavin reductase